MRGTGLGSTLPAAFGLALLGLQAAGAASLPTDVGTCSETAIEEIGTRLVPADCPPGDDRGKIYAPPISGTGESWELPDSQHSCGGA